MSYLPKGLPEPVTETDKLDQPYSAGHPSREADGAALRRVSDLAVGTGVDLSRMPFLGHEMGGG